MKILNIMFFLSFGMMSYGLVDATECSVREGVCGQPVKCNSISDECVDRVYAKAAVDVNALNELIRLAENGNSRAHNFVFGYADDRSQALEYTIKCAENGDYMAIDRLYELSAYHNNTQAFESIKRCAEKGYDKAFRSLRLLARYYRSAEAEACLKKYVDKGIKEAIFHYNLLLGEIDNDARKNRKVVQPEDVSLHKAILDKEAELAALRDEYRAKRAQNPKTAKPEPDFALDEMSKVFDDSRFLKSSERAQVRRLAKLERATKKLREAINNL